MLIEAAYSLPKWLKPEVAANRVWIRGGALHIIPQPSPSSPGLPAFPTLHEALLILKSPDVLTGSGSVTTACPTAAKVESAVRRRLGGLPESALADIQRLPARLPVRIAAALAVDPQIMSHAVEAFCFR
jgi:hypothetical protein